MIIRIKPDCDNCEYQDEDGRCTAYDESTSFDPLSGEEQEVERMTREEAIAWIKSIKDKYIHGGDDDFDEKRKKSLDMAVNALEQEDVLDKIRAEIADLDDADYDYEGYYKAVTDAVEIIDKYRTESEV